MNLRRSSVVVIAVFAALLVVLLVQSRDDNGDPLASCVSRALSAESNVVACTELLEQDDGAGDLRDYVFIKRAGAYRRQRMYEEAFSDINEAIELSPGKVTPWVNRAWTHGLAGNDDEMHADFEKALSLGVETAFVLRNRARMHWRHGEYDRAYADFVEVLKHEPDNVDAILRIAKIQIGRRDYEKAISHLSRSAAVVPHEPDIHGLLGRLHHHHTGNYQAALRAFTEYAKTNPTDEFGPFLIGATHFKLGNVDAGKQYMEIFVDTRLENRNPTSIGDFSENLSVDLLLGESQRNLFLVVGYGMAGQRDLAREAFDQFVEDGGHAASVVMDELLVEYGGLPGTDEPASDGNDKGANFEHYLDSLESAFTQDAFLRTVSPFNTR